jgi:hypothetical protein
MLWLMELAKDKRLTKRDRNYRELKTLAEAVEVGGTYDQLNLGSNLVFEVLLRRAAAVAHAIRNGAEHPDWTLADQITGELDNFTLLTPATQQEVNRKAKEKMDIEILQQRLSVGRGGSAAGPSGSSGYDPLTIDAHVDVGGLPAGGARGRGGKNDAKGDKGGKPPGGRARGRGDNRPRKLEAEVPPGGGKG